MSKQSVVYLISYLKYQYQYHKVYIYIVIRSWSMTWDIFLYNSTKFVNCSPSFHNWAFKAHIKPTKIPNLISHNILQFTAKKSITTMAIEAYSSQYPDKIHKDVLSDARQACYKVIILHIIHTLYRYI